MFTRSYIRSANDGDVAAIVTVLADCQRDLLGRGICQWPKAFPDPNEVAGGVAEGRTYVLLDQDSVRAVVTLSPFMPEMARHVQWLTDKPFLRVCRLAVHPRLQRHGFGRSLMCFAEQVARERQIVSLRLGAYSQHPEAIAFYERLGYQRVGEARNPACQDPFVCMEKVF